MPNCRDAKLLQGLVRQTRKNRLVYLIFAECCLIFAEAQAPQLDHDVHDGAPTHGRRYHGPAPRGVSSGGIMQSDSSPIRPDNVSQGCGKQYCARQIARGGFDLKALEFQFLDGCQGIRRRELDVRKCFRSPNQAHTQILAPTCGEGSAAIARHSRPEIFCRFACFGRYVPSAPFKTSSRLRSSSAGPPTSRPA
jgi:hypothetical protein